MGWRFRKSVKIAPGVRVNFGKKSTSVSFGSKGFRTTYSSSGRKTTSVGIPGTGISYSKTTGKKKKSVSKTRSTTPAYSSDPMTPRYSSTTYKVCGIISMVISIPVLLLCLMVVFVEPMTLILMVPALLLLFVGLGCKKLATMAKEAETKKLDNNQQ